MFVDGGHVSSWFHGVGDWECAFHYPGCAREVQETGVCGRYVPPDNKVYVSRSCKSGYCD